MSSTFTYFTFLIDYNNPFNRFRPDATHPSKRLCCLRACASWSHLSMIGLSRQRSADPRIKYSSRRSILFLTNDIAEPAQPLDNTLHNIQVVERGLLLNCPLRPKELVREILHLISRLTSFLVVMAVTSAVI